MSQIEIAATEILDTSSIQTPSDARGVQACLTQCLSALTSILNDDRAITREQTETLINVKNYIYHALDGLRPIMAIDNSLNDILSFVEEDWRKYESSIPKNNEGSADEIIWYKTDEYRTNDDMHMKVIHALNDALCTLWAFHATLKQRYDTSKDVGNCIKTPNSVEHESSPSFAWMKGMLEKKVDKRCKDVQQRLGSLKKKDTRYVSRLLGDADLYIRASAVKWEQSRHDILNNVLAELDSSMTALAAGRRVDEEY